MREFFRFPHTPHLAWLGAGAPRDDKVLTDKEADFLLAGEVVVEEKLDGANLGLSLTMGGDLEAQNRGQYLTEPYAGQFSRLPAWLAQHGEGLHKVLEPNLILFGEWCVARHSLDYASLPDWFLLFDVYDSMAGRFWNKSRRNLLAVNAGLVTVPEVFEGPTTLTSLTQLVATSTSRFRQGALEGVIIRRESVEWCVARAKLVRPEFTQAMDTHWRKRKLEWNRLG